MCVYSKCTARDKAKVDRFIHITTTYDIIMGDFNDNIWASPPTRPWQEGLDDARLLGPLLSTSHHRDVGQYYTHIPRHGRPRRLDAILIRQQIPNVPSTYYNVINMPISDHSLVLLGLRWRVGGRPKTSTTPQPTIWRSCAPHFKRFTTQISSMGQCTSQVPVMKARHILGAITRAARPWKTRCHHVPTWTFLCRCRCRCRCRVECMAGPVLIDLLVRCLTRPAGACDVP